MPSVVLDQVSKEHTPGQFVVKNLNLSIEPGELIVLVGPSGCGKSTTLNMISGLDHPTQGTIWIGDRIVNKVPPKNRDIAMVFQNYALYPHMTVEGNLGFALKLRGYSKNEIKARVLETAQSLGLEAYLKRLPRHLSGGQRQRVAVGRAMVRNSSVYLFDEPLSNLDAGLRTQMRLDIHDLHKKIGKTMIYVTHDQIEAMTLGTRIVVMRDGVIEQIDTPMRLYQYPKTKFVAGFIGSPPMNFMDGTLYRRDQGVYFLPKGEDREIALSQRFRPLLRDSAEKKLSLGFRPESLGSFRARRTEGTIPLRGRVRMVEMLGAESLVHLTIGTHGVVGRWDQVEHVREGDTIDVPLMEEAINLFDNDTGLNITQ